MKILLKSNHVLNNCFISNGEYFTVVNNNLVKIKRSEIMNVVFENENVYFKTFENDCIFGKIVKKVKGFFIVQFQNFLFQINDTDIIDSRSR